MYFINSFQYLLGCHVGMINPLQFMIKLAQHKQRLNVHAIYIYIKIIIIFNDIKCF